MLKRETCKLDRRPGLLACAGQSWGHCMSPVAPCFSSGIMIFQNVGGKWHEVMFIVVPLFPIKAGKGSPGWGPFFPTTYDLAKLSVLTQVCPTRNKDHKGLGFWNYPDHPLSCLLSRACGPPRAAFVWATLHKSLRLWSFMTALLLEFLILHTKAQGLHLKPALLLQFQKLNKPDAGINWTAAFDLC